MVGNFDSYYFEEIVKSIIKTDHTEAIIKILKLIYDYYDILDLNMRNSLVNNYFLGNIFFKYI